MHRGVKPAAMAATVMLVVTGAWVGVQCLLAAAHGRESAAAFARMLTRLTMEAAARGQAAPHLEAPETGAAFWWPIVQANTVHLVALAVLGLALVIAGRRRSWAGLGIVAFVHPDLTEGPLMWLRPIGFGWSGPWVATGTAVGEPAPGLPVLPALGALIDLLVIALPAIAYLLATRRAARPDVVPTRLLLSRLAVPFAVLGGGLAAYASVDSNGGQPFQRLVAVLLVLTAAGLLSATRLGPIHAVVIVSVVAAFASDEVSGAVQFFASGHRNGEFWSTVLTNTAPLAAVAAVGAVCASHGPAIASTYRRLVRRPAVTRGNA